MSKNDKADGSEVSESTAKSGKKKLPPEEFEKVNKRKNEERGKILGQFEQMNANAQESLLVVLNALHAVKRREKTKTRTEDGEASPKAKDKTPAKAKHTKLWAAEEFQLAEQILKEVVKPEPNRNILNIESGFLAALRRAGNDDASLDQLRDLRLPDDLTEISELKKVISQIAKSPPNTTADLPDVKGDGIKKKEEEPGPKFGSKKAEEKFKIEQLKAKNSSVI